MTTHLNSIQLCTKTNCLAHEYQLKYHQYWHNYTKSLVENNILRIICSLILYMLFHENK